MTNDSEIRWEQRFSNFEKALHKLKEAVFYITERVNDKDKDSTSDAEFEILREGLIQRFEYTHELAWNVMKDFLFEVGNVKLYGSKDATREAFKAGLIEDGDSWMEMILSRNKSSHTYNEETAKEIYDKIIYRYLSALQHFQKVISEKRKSGK